MMLIPIPILMWYATLTGQPVMVMIVPGEAPVYSVPAPAKTSEAEASGNCFRPICEA